jgi:hypothetical protein
MDQSIVLQTLFLLRGCKNKRGNINELPPTKPRSLPKGGFTIVPNGDSSGVVEDVHILTSARVSIPHPDFVEASPFKPWQS